MCVDGGSVVATDGAPRTQRSACKRPAKADPKSSSAVQARLQDSGSVVATVDIRVVGNVEVRRGGEAVAIGGAGHRFVSLSGSWRPLKATSRSRGSASSGASASVANVSPSRISGVSACRAKASTSATRDSAGA